jgi:thiol-disulfide isomerase/thioredoxin
MTAPRILLSALLLGVLLATSGVGWAQDKPSVRFRIRSLSGALFDSRQAAEPLVLSFFFTRCPPCLEEMPALWRRMQAQGREAQLLFVNPYVPELGIQDQPDTERRIREFVRKLGLPEERVFFDELGTLAKRLARAEAFPQAQRLGTLMLFPSIVVLKQGQIQRVLEGSDPEFLQQIEASW